MFKSSEHVYSSTQYGWVYNHILYQLLLGNYIPIKTISCFSKKQTAAKEKEDNFRTGGKEEFKKTKRKFEKALSSQTVILGIALGYFYKQ